MPGHILYYPYIPAFEPVGNHALPDLLQVLHLRVDLLGFDEVSCESCCLSYHYPVGIRINDHAGFYLLCIHRRA